METPPIPEGYTVLERITGHIIKRAPGAGNEANWGYKATSADGTECALLYCNPGVFTIVDLDKLEELEKHTWCIMKTGYAGAHITLGEKRTMITMHALLMNHVGHGRGQTSVDHINQNKLDNRMANLHLASQSEQNANRGKVSRKFNACQLPEGLTQDDLPKFIVYYSEKIYPVTETNKDKRREFFRVEKHPLQNLKEAEPAAYSVEIKISWASSKAGAKTIQEKLAEAEAKAYLNLLNTMYESVKK
jgi:hypothetical protein